MSKYFHHYIYITIDRDENGKKKRKQKTKQRPQHRLNLNRFLNFFSSFALDIEEVIRSHKSQTTQWPKEKVQTMI
jgi:hypothetical protein